MRFQVIFVFFLFFVVSCTTEDKPYSYLCDSNTNAETIELTYICTDNLSPFRYTFQSREMCIQWGDSQSPSDYIFIGQNDSINTLKPISHFYPSVGDYQVTVKALLLVSLDLSQTGTNIISELKLTNANFLEKLYCENQPILDINVAGCSALEELICGFSGGTQSLSDININSKLRVLSINGSTNYNDLNLSANDSLQMLSFKKTNLSKLQVSDLILLSELTIDSCPSFLELHLANNLALKQLVITNNSSLGVSEINSIFSSLPQADQKDCFIVLAGNEGDEFCDRSIATNKGWSFKDTI